MQARIVITTQPATTGYRFRYKCEGKTAGTIPGVKTDGKKKTVPTFKLENFPKGAKVEVYISCVTANRPYRNHPHVLVGSNCENDFCKITLQKTHSASLQGVGIRCVKKDEFIQSISNRAKFNINPFNVPDDDDCTYDAKAVRLAIQAHYDGQLIGPVVTEIIRDSKSDCSLNICKVYKCVSPAKGGEEIILLTEKILKDDIAVQFYEEDDNGEMIWEARGEFNSNDVHKQFAIVLTTPPYKDQNLSGRKDVWIRLLQPSTQDTGEARPFTYTENDLDPTKRKRKADASLQMSSLTKTSGHLLIKPELRKPASATITSFQFLNNLSTTSSSSSNTPALEQLICAPPVASASQPIPIPSVIAQYESENQSEPMIAQPTDDDMSTNPYIQSNYQGEFVDPDLLQYLIQGGGEGAQAVFDLQTLDWNQIVSDGPNKGSLKMKFIKNNPNKSYTKKGQ